MSDRQSGRGGDIRFEQAQKRAVAVTRKKLTGRKEIAAFLEIDQERRVSHLAENHGLPVYRRGPELFAYTDELAEWDAKTTTTWHGTALAKAG